MAVEERFCDERHEGICKAIELHVAYMEKRFDVMEKGLNTKIHATEEKVKNKIAVWGIVVAGLLVILEIIIQVGIRR